MLLYPKFGGSRTVTDLGVNFQLLLKDMICLIVLIRRITTTITGSKVYHLSLEKRWHPVVLVGNCKFTPKGLAAQLPTLLVLTNTYFKMYIRIYIFMFYSIDTYLS